jgi:hypothetical protein
MKKILALCLALSGMVAVGALSAGSASAAAGEIDLACHTGADSCFLFGEQTETNTFTFTGGNLKCTSAKFTGEGTGGTTATTVASKEADWSFHTVTVHPEYSGCAFGGQALTIITTGCNYVLTASSKTAGNVSVECETGKLITLKANTAGCTITIGAQTPGNNKVEYANAGTGSEKDVTVTAKVGEATSGGGITYTSSGGICGASGTNGTYRGAVTEKCFTTSAHKTQAPCALVETKASGEIE